MASMEGIDIALTPDEQKTADAFLEMFPPGTLVFVWGTAAMCYERVVDMAVWAEVVQAVTLHPAYKQARHLCCMTQSGCWVPLTNVCRLGDRFDPATGGIVRIP